VLEDWRMRAARRVPPIWAIAIAVVAVSTSAILIRWSRAPSIVAAFYRVLFTTLLLAPFLGTGDRAPLTSLGRGALLAAGATGVALALHFATWFESLRWTSVAASVTLVQTQPVFVAIGAALLLDERVGPRGAAGIVVALVGMAAMSLSGAGGATVSSPRPLYGNGLAIAGAVLMAAYVLAGRRLRQEIALLPYVLVVYAVCTVVLCLLALAQGVSLVAYPPREWLLFLGMAVGPGILGHTTINWALEHVESSVVSVSLLGEPVGSALLAVVLLAEVPGVGTVLGGTVVLAGIYVTVSARRD
jgi:drug/metabolite transporter (DMT)-like permease